MRIRSTRINVFISLTVALFATVVFLCVPEAKADKQTVGHGVTIHIPPRIGLSGDRSLLNLDPIHAGPTSLEENAQPARYGIRSPRQGLQTKILSTKLMENRNGYILETNVGTLKNTQVLTLTLTDI